jgi:signal transduction histidine kinase
MSSPWPKRIAIFGIDHQSGHASPGQEHAFIRSRRRSSDDGLSFEVRDDGPGFDATRASDGMGLQNMRDRVGALDGRLSITPAAGDGTIVSGVIPLRTSENSTGSRTGA